MERQTFDLPVKKHQIFRRMDAATLAHQKTRKVLAIINNYVIFPLAISLFAGANLSYLYFATGATSIAIAAVGTIVPTAVVGLVQLAISNRFVAAKAWRQDAELSWLNSEMEKLEKEEDSLRDQIKGLQKDIKDYEKLLENEGGEIKAVDFVSVLRLKTTAIDNLYRELRSLKTSLDARELQLAELWEKLDESKENLDRLMTLMKEDQESVNKDKYIKRRFIPIRQLGVDEKGEGKGGMGSIYKAYDKNREKGERVVVLKFVKPGMLADETIIARFMTEARVLQKVPGTHYVQYIEDGELDRAAYTAITGIRLADGPPVPYIEMEYMTDQTLEEIIDIERRLEPEKVLAIGMHLAEGIGFLHEQGVAHRDIKPANIFLDTNYYRPRLGDLGIVKEEKDTGMTQTGTIMGSVSYMSPEAIMGQCKTHQDFARADVHSLAAAMFEMLTGTLPRGEGIKEMGKLMVEIATTDPPETIKVPGVTESLAAVILKGLASDPLDRYQSMQKYNEALYSVTL